MGRGGEDLPKALCEISAHNLGLRRRYELQVSEDRPQFRGVLCRGKFCAGRLTSVFTR